MPLFGPGGVIGKTSGGGGGEPSNALVWGGEWEDDNTPYAANTFLKDVGYAGITLQATSERLQPILVGQPAYTLPADGTGFVSQDDGSVVYSGNLFTFTKSGFLSKVRVRVPTVSADTNYRFILADVTDPALPKVSIIEEPPLEANEWVTIAANQALVLEGAKLLVYIDALNSGADTVFTGGWRYGGTSNSDSPATQGWNRRNQNNIIRFDKTDLDSTDRSSELLGATVGTTIQSVETANTSNYFTHRVTGVPVDQGTYVEYPVSLVDQGGSGVPSGEVSTATFTVPVPQLTDYYENVGYWSTNEPSWATVEGYLEYSGVPQVGVEDNAYGIDIEFQEGIPSTHYDYLPFVGVDTSSTSSTASNQVINSVGLSRVIVKGDDDLPALEGGYSPLKANTEYFFQNGIVITKPLKIDVEGVTLSGTGPFGSGVTYTGTLPFLTAEGQSLEWRYLSLTSNTASQVFDVSGTATNTFYSTAMNLEGSAKLGHFDGVSPVFRDLVAVNFTQGFTFASTSGFIRGASFVNAFMVDDNVSSAAHFDLASAIFLDFELTAVLMDTVAGVGTPVCVSSDIGGQANIIPLIESEVTGCTFGLSGPMVTLQGFDDGFQTNQWNFQGNSPIPLVADTDYSADLYLNAGSANTVSITTSGVFYDLGVPSVGTWDSDISDHFTPNLDGSITYTGVKPIVVEAMHSSTCNAGGFFGDQMETRLALNWTPGDDAATVYKTRSITDSGAPDTMNGSGKVPLVQGDNLRIVWSNNSATNDISVLSAKIDISLRG